MNYVRRAWIRRLVWPWRLRKNRAGMSSLAMLSTDGGIAIEQTKLAPDGLESAEDVSDARWVEESLTDFGTLRALLPDGFPAYARVFHPAYLDGDQDRPVRWSTVASWTGRTVHPLMQFQRIAGLSEDPQHMYKNPPWGPILSRVPSLQGSAAPWSRCFGTSPRLLVVASSAFGKATETSTPAYTRPVLG